VREVNEWRHFMAANQGVRTVAAVLLGLALCCALTAANAQARSVSGTQTTVDEAAGTYKMSGDLVGDWSITTFKELATAPLYQGKGRELFDGCLDKGHDGSCGSADPSGKLRLVFRYWALFADDGSTLGGACWHPIVGGTGAFKHARGTIQMLDTPTGEGGAVETHYVGTIRMGKGHRAAPRASSARSCG
jgi:hypothetical protein